MPDDGGIPSGILARSAAVMVVVGGVVDELGIGGSSGSAGPPALASVSHTRRDCRMENRSFLPASSTAEAEPLRVYFRQLGFRLSTHTAGVAAGPALARSSCSRSHTRWVQTGHQATSIRQAWCRPSSASSISSSQTHPPLSPQIRQVVERRTPTCPIPAGLPQPGAACRQVGVCGARQGTADYVVLRLP